jgi:hypothetical protein
MSSNTLALTIETPLLDAAASWSMFESLAVQMSKDLPWQALDEALDEAQDRLIYSVVRAALAPVPGLAAPFACPKCQASSDFARKPGSPAPVDR